jgi:hypothetical protein
MSCVLGRRHIPLKEVERLAVCCDGRGQVSIYWRDALQTHGLNEEMTQRVRRVWSEEDVRRLRLLAGGMVRPEFIAKTLGRSVISIKLKAHWLNLSLGGARRKAKRK